MHMQAEQILGPSVVDSCDWWERRAHRDRGGCWRASAPTIGVWRPRAAIREEEIFGDDGGGAAVHCGNEPILARAGTKSDGILGKRRPRLLPIVAAQRGGGDTARARGWTVHGQG